MPVDRLLTTVLRAYQEPLSTKRDQIFGTTLTLLTKLNNPLNISLLTSHLLTARSIWESEDDGLRTCLRIISIFNTAARHVLRNEEDNKNNANKPSWGYGYQPPVVGSGVSRENWARAVAKGADERSMRWKHVLVLTGLLMGLEGEERRSLSRGLRATLEHAVVMAANLALEDPLHTMELGANAVVLALTYALPVLSESNKRFLNGDAVLSAAVQAMVGGDGFCEGDFLRTISAGNVAGHETFYRASPDSFATVRNLESRPLAQNMGALSRLTAFAVRHATDSGVVLQAQEKLLAFSDGLRERWRQCPFSAIDISAEPMVLTPDILQGPWVILWQLLKKIMYTVVAILQPIVGRCLLDPHLRNDLTAPTVATKTLHTLCNLYFISSRQGADAFQVYTFTYLTSIDILSRHPDACISFLQETLPPPQQPNSPPPTLLDQALMLFYINTAEHLPLSLPTPMSDSLILGPATSYLSTSPALPQTSLTLPLFEASHSAILSVLSCPQHSELTIALIPFYIDTLLNSFPSHISPRQFRLAFKTVTQITSPPFPISTSHPQLSETLLELLHFRSLSASATPLPPEPTAATPENTAASPPPVLSEQSTLVLALIDALPFVPLHHVEEWLTRTAEAMNAITDVGMRETARKRFWDVLVSGEMDVERAAIGVAWWGTHRGREMVLLGGPEGVGQKQEEEYFMSGALGERSRL